MTAATSVEALRPHADLAGKSPGAMLGDGTGSLDRAPLKIVDEKRTEILTADGDGDDVLTLDDVIRHSSDERHSQLFHTHDSLRSNTEQLRIETCGAKAVQRLNAVTNFLFDERMGAVA